MTLSLTRRPALSALDALASSGTVALTGKLNIKN